MRHFATTLLLGMALSHLTVTAGTAADSGSRGELGSVLLQNTSATHFIWTDNLWYQSGDNHTLRWTFDPQNDPYPYTIFVYRENIRTGEREYVVAGTGFQSDVTDVFGNGPGSYLVSRPAPTRALELISGPVPSEAGNYQFVAELRDATATQIVKKAYAKFNVVDNIVTLGEGSTDVEISEDTTWTSTTLYRILFQVFVNDGATLTIEPGTLVVAQGQNAVIVVERGGQVIAEGRRELPIVMTCDAPLGQRISGCWAGLIVLGRAPENIEGADALAEGVLPATRPVYGGDDPNDSSGIYKFVRVEFAGVDFSNEIQPNAFGFHSAGAGTSICYIQAHEGEDDGIEYFGGAANMDHFVSDGSKDDSVDSAVGWTGYAQFGFVLQDEVEADRGYEGDNNENGFNNTPVTNPRFYNVTFIGSSISNDGITTRRGHQGEFWNNIIMGFGAEGYDPADDSDGTFRNNIFWLNNGGDTTLAGQVSDDGIGAITASPTNQSVGPMLLNARYEGNPEPLPLEGSPAVVIGAGATPPAIDNQPGGVCGSAIDTNGGFVGGFDRTNNWLEEWTFFGSEDNYDDDPNNDTLP